MYFQFSPTRFRNNLAIRFKRKLKIITEKLRGIDLTQVENNKRLGLEEFGEGIFYAPSEKVDLINLFNQLDIKTSDKILDLGAGKGAAMLLMDEYGFNEVKGVEISKDLCFIANKNFQKLSKDHLKVIESDARDYTDLDNFNYFYFFHPFPYDVFDEVLKNIYQSTERKPRFVCLIYYNPAYDDLFKKKAWLTLLKKVEGWRYDTCIYVNLLTEGSPLNS